MRHNFCVLLAGYQDNLQTRLDLYCLISAENFLSALPDISTKLHYLDRLTSAGNFLVCAVSPLEGFGRQEWVCFERALVVRDMFLGGERTFLSQEDARAFRSMIYAQYGETATITPDLTRFL